MSSELWDQIRSTRYQELEENRAQDGVFVKRDLFKMLKIEWGVTGVSEDNTRYGLSGIEYDPAHISAKWVARFCAKFGVELDPKPSMDVVLSTKGAEQGGCAPTESVYLVHLADGELVNARGSLVIGGEQRPLNNEQAALGFQTALETASFKLADQWRQT